jgi:hypothetical protein
MIPSQRNKLAPGVIAGLLRFHIAGLLGLFLPGMSCFFPVR